MPIDGISPPSVNSEIPDPPTEFNPRSMVTSRRTMLKGAAATGIGVATAGVVADILFAGPASAATTDNSSDDADLVAHVRDARTGQIDLYVGTRQVSVQDRALASRLARAAK
jgi:TAT (twin-arginine translocation) pathway signal sequence